MPDYPAAPPDFYNSVSITDAATILGKVRGTIYGMIARGELTGARFDKYLRVVKDEKYEALAEAAYDKA